MVKILSKAAYPAFALAVLTVTFSCQKSIEKPTAPNEETATKAIPPKDLKDFVQVNLVGDNDEYDPARIDPNLVNGWGISFPTSGKIFPIHSQDSDQCVQDHTHHYHLQDLPVQNLSDLLEEWL